MVRRPGVRRVNTNREIQQPSISTLTAPSSAYSNARAAIFDNATAKSESIPMHTSQGPLLVANCNSLSPRLENGNCSCRASISISLWVSQSSQFLGYLADILTFLLKMLANKGHILCMPLFKSNRETVHAKLPLESG